VEPWLPIPKDHVARAVSLQDGDSRSVLATARLLIALRRESEALKEGEFHPLALAPPLLGFERTAPGQKLRCLFNLGRDAMPCDALGTGRIVFSAGAVSQADKKMGPLSACYLELD